MNEIENIIRYIAVIALGIVAVFLGMNFISGAMKSHRHVAAQSTPAPDQIEVSAPAAMADNGSNAK